MGAQLVETDADLNSALAPGGQSTAMEAATLVGKIGDQPQLRLISMAVTATGLLISNPRLARAGMRMLLAHEIATLAKNFVKDGVDRTRPRSADSNAERRPRRGRNSAKEESSFPSGHTAGAIAVARAFGREYPRYRAPALAAAGLVAAAQVTRCAHYPSDILAGAAVGVASELLSTAVWAGGEGSPR